MSAVCVFTGAAMFCAAQEQYPKPLIHTPANHPAARVLLLSIDGLHAFDLANWLAAHPRSILAELSARGVTYTNAHTPMADPAAGLLAFATGGTPISTGIVNSDGYDHLLSPPGSSCKTKGVVLALDASFSPDGTFDTSKAPLDPRNGCTALWPHSLLHVNTIFEVVREKIGPTAWAGESAATTDLLSGPSGKGLNDACSFKRGTSPVGDESRVAAVLHWIDGKDCTGVVKAAVPSLFGMSFTSLAASQAAAGYIDAAGTPSDGLEKSFEFVDASISRMVRELKARQLYDTTWIFVTAPYGQSPMDYRRRRVIPVAQVGAIVNEVQPGLVAHISGGDSSLIWLNDSAKTAAVVKAFGDRAAAIGIQEIYSGARLALTLNSPEKDSRMPDIILQPELGVLWGSPGEAALAAHGGMLDEDTHVALLVSGAQLTGRYDPTYVPTTQVAPLLLRALGMEKFDLQALHLEHSPALPGIF
jgi:Type I phosphodiesterase / nucleotide pyrophosphatase